MRMVDFQPFQVQVQVHDRFSNSFVYLGCGGLEKLRRVGEAHVRGEGAKVQHGGGAEVEAEGGSATYCGCSYTIIDPSSPGWLPNKIIISTFQHPEN